MGSGHSDKTSADQKIDWPARRDAADLSGQLGKAVRHEARLKELVAKQAELNRRYWTQT